MKKEKSALCFLYEVTGKHKIGIFILTLLHTLLGMSSVCFAMFMRGALDGATAKDTGEFGKYLLMLIGLVITQISLRAIVRFLEEHTRSSVENALKSRLFSSLLKKDYAQVTQTHSGEWMNRLTSDTVVAANATVEILPNLAGMFVKLLGAFVMIFVLEPRFIYILVPGGLLMFVFTYAFRKVLKKLHKRIQESDGELRVFLQERLGSLMMIRAFVAEDSVETEANEKMAMHKAMRMKRNRFSNVCNIGFAGAMNGMYLLGFAYGGYGILQGTITYGTMFAVLQLISQIQSPFANISGYLPRFYAMLASAERLMEAEKYKDDDVNVDADKEGKEILNMEMVQDMYQKEFKLIVVNHVDFSYPGDDLQVFTDANLSINKGDYVAFVGHSGCGKSTLFKLLLCLYPMNQGEILIELQNQKMIHLARTWRRFFAYVPQGNQLMNGTIREIVTFSKNISKQEKADEKINQALRIACAEEFITELPDGVDTLLGERGAGLSEGQMQRIAIARAIYADSPILLLDEATSALDEQTEEKLLMNLKNMTDKTVLIVTHRPAALDICNRIIEVTESGMKEIEKTNER